MGISDVLQMVGGLALFLYGMSILGKSLEKLSGGRMEKILEKMTSNRLKAVLFGALATAVVQSSTATTVMVVGFVNSGIMKLGQAVGIIMGANVGTTVTSWILSLAGVDGTNLFLTLIKPTSFAPIMAMIGVTLGMFSKSDKRKDVGTMLVGFSILMQGMSMMSTGATPLAEVEGFTNVLLMFSNPILGMVAGAVLTAILHSSAASIGILQAFCLSGAVTYGTAIPIIMGQNIGTCVTALLSGIGASKNAKRAACVHLYFNLIGTTIFMAVFYTLNAFMKFAFLNEPLGADKIAFIHSIFNVSATILLIPFAGLLEKLAVWTIRDKNGEAEKEQEEEKDFQVLDVRFLDVPGYAMEQCKTVTMHMAEKARQAIFYGIDLLETFDEEKAEELVRLESLIDRYEDALGTYLLKLSERNLSVKDNHTVSKFLHCIGDFERISDHAVNLLDAAKEMHEKKMVFSDRAKEELAVFTRAVKDIVNLTVEVFESEDREHAKMVEPLEEVIDNLNQKIKSRHIQRLRTGECTIELGFVLSDISTNYERVSDHCSNIAVCIIQMNMDVMEAHEYLDTLKSPDNLEFVHDYEAVKKKYRLPVLEQKEEPAV